MNPAKNKKQKKEKDKNKLTKNENKNKNKNENKIIVIKIGNLMGKSRQKRRGALRRKEYKSDDIHGGIIQES